MQQGSKASVTPDKLHGACLSKRTIAGLLQLSSSQDSSRACGKQTATHTSQVLSCLLMYASCTQGGGAVSSVAATAAKTAAGLSSGHVACLDTRTGVPTAMWRAHQAAVSALTVLDDCHVLTASQAISLSTAVTTILFNWVVLAACTRVCCFILACRLCMA